MILPACGRGAHGRQVGLVGHGGVVLAGDEGLRRRAGLHVHDRHVLHGQAVLLQEPGEREIGRGAGRRGRDRLALEVLDRGDRRCAPPCRRRRRSCRAGRSASSATPLAFHTTQVSTVVAAHWMSPDCDREVAARLRDLLDRHVEAVLLEDAGLLGEGQRREAGPAARCRSPPSCPARRRRLPQAANNTIPPNSLPTSSLPPIARTASPKAGRRPSRSSLQGGSATAPAFYVSNVRT